MKLRFNISEPINTGSPDYTICNQVSTFISFTNLELLLKIDGTNIINTTDLSSISFPIAPITTTNGLTVGVDLENSNYIVLDINLNNIWDFTNIEYQISKTGYWSFNKIFEIYGYDLGKNPNLTPITDSNPDFNIILLNKTNNEVNGFQTKAYSSFITYKRPYTNQLHFYKSNSGQGEISYINSDLETISYNSDGFICVTGEYSLKQLNNIYSLINNIKTLVDSCLSSLITLNNTNLFPSFEANTTCVDCNDDCIVVNTNNNTTTYIDYTTLTHFFVNDVEVNPFTTQYISYKLIDFTGNEILNQTNTFNINPLPFVYDPSTTLFSFQIPEIGDYIIQVEVGVTNLYKCIKNYPINGCNFYEIKNSDCNEFTIYNKGFEDFIVNISELQDDKSFLPISEITVNALSNSIINHNEDNIYTYTVTKNNINYIFIVVNYCNLRNCLLKHISKLLCKDKHDEDKCDECNHKDYYDFNSLIITAHTYFNMLNNEYNFNYIYESLSPDKINELFELSQFLKRFKEYCEHCNKICNCNK